MCDLWLLYRSDYQLCVDAFKIGRLSRDGLAYHLSRLGFKDDEITREINHIVVSQLAAKAGMGGRGQHA